MLLIKQLASNPLVVENDILATFNLPFVVCEMYLTLAPIKVLKYLSTHRRNDI
jgi:hypothetical protein